MLTPDDLRAGLEVRMKAESGLDTDTTYRIHSYDPISDTVRLEGVLGSFSVWHIEGIELRPHIPAEEAGVSEGTPSEEETERLLKTSAVAGLDGASTMALIETHLVCIINACTDEATQKFAYHARMALLLFYHLAGLDKGVEE